MTRSGVPAQGDERTLLNAFLDFHRATVRIKCEGLSEADAHRAVLPSSPLMTPAGLVSHLYWVERDWFNRHFLGEPDEGPWTDEDPDAEMRVDDVPLATLLDRYDEQCERSREIAAAHDLDTLEKTEPANGRPVSLRWIVMHMVEETARHNGHLDAMRELLDGAVGE
jgi:uncharacterized damage-inducible protein DinB